MMLTILLPYIISFCAVSSATIYMMKYTERAHMREKGRLVGKYVREQVLPNRVVQAMDTYVAPRVSNQILVLMDIFVGFLEGIDNTRPLYALVITKENGQQTEIDTREACTQIEHLIVSDSATQTDIVIQPAVSEAPHVSVVPVVPVVPPKPAKDEFEEASQRIPVVSAMHAIETVVAETVAQAAEAVSRDIFKDISRNVDEASRIPVTKNVTFDYIDSSDSDEPNIHKYANRFIESSEQIKPVKIEKKERKVIIDPKS